MTIRSNVDASTHRVFFALAPDARACGILSGIIGALEVECEDRLRWLSRPNWHVTLRFIGNATQRQLHVLRELVADVVAGYRSFDVTFTQIEPFPSSKRPLVLAATVVPAEAAAALVGDIEAVCRALDLPAERRPWRPHLTLARVRGRREIEFTPIHIDVAFAAQSVLLMESMPAARGRDYVRIAQMAFAQGD